MNAQEWLRRAAEGKPLPEDPIYDVAVDIVDCVTRNLQQEVPTYDGQHVTDIEAILRRFIINFSEKYSMTPASSDSTADKVYCEGFNAALMLADGYFNPDENDNSSL